MAGAPLRQRVPVLKGLHRGRGRATRHGDVHQLHQRHDEVDQEPGERGILAGPDQDLQHDQRQQLIQGVRVVTRERHVLSDQLLPGNQRVEDVQGESSAAAAGEAGEDVAHISARSVQGQGPGPADRSQPHVRTSQVLPEPALLLVQPRLQEPEGQSRVQSQPERQEQFRSRELIALPVHHGEAQHVQPVSQSQQAYRDTLQYLLDTCWVATRHQMRRCAVEVKSYYF